MGYNTVAVLLNDRVHEIEQSGEFGKRLALAIRRFSSDDARHVPGAYVCSQDHASGFQVVIAHGNIGCRLLHDNAAQVDALLNDPNAWLALNAMKECLERHGYKLTKPRKQKEVSK